MKDKLNNKYSKSVNIRHSIRTKLVLITIAMVFMIILGGVITNLLFMERYYTSQKADALTVMSKPRTGWLILRLCRFGTQLKICRAYRRT